VNAGQLADQLAIVDVVNRYATALDTHDWDLLDQVFSSDVIGDFSDHQLLGREAVKDMIRGMLGGCGPSQHLLANHRVELDGDLATCICSVRASAAGRGDDAQRTYELWGEYHDQLRRLPEGWRIVERSMRVSFEQGARDLLGTA
jgi:hypothetical protein